MQCSIQGHSVCQAAPRFSNCKRPHAVDERYCPALPTVRQGTTIHLSQQELKRIRPAGKRAWLLVNLVITVIPISQIKTSAENPSVKSHCWETQTGATNKESCRYFWPIFPKGKELRLSLSPGKQKASK